MYKYLIGAFAIYMLYMFLKPTTIDLAIDNPTDKAYTVSVDELHVEIPAKEVVWVEMGKGEHIVTLEDGSTHPYDYTSGAYFLNPTKSEYLVTESFFGSEASHQSYSLSNPGTTVNYMGMELEGNYNVISDLISPVTWEVGAREPMPESVQADEGENYVVIKKLMGPAEFSNQLIEAFQNMPQE